MLRTFETEDEVYQKFKEVCLRERVKVGDKINEFIKEYIKVHGEGNPVYPLDEWVKHPDTKIYPAFGRPIDEWISYLQKHPEDAEVIHGHALGLKRAVEKRFIL